MKKNLLSLIALLGLASSMSAASLTFYVDGKPVEQNGTVDWEEYNTVDYGTMVSVEIEPKVFISPSSTETFTVKTISNESINLCIGEQCEPGTTIVKNNLSFAANSQNDLLIDCYIDFLKGQEVVVPEIHVEIQAWYNSDPSKVTVMHLNMGKIAGVASAVIDENQVSVVGNSLKYNVKGANTITLFNLSGRAVGKYNVQGEGSISLEGLGVGVYLYRLQGEKAGKFVIR